MSQDSPGRPVGCEAVARWKSTSGADSRTNRSISIAVTTQARAFSTTAGEVALSGGSFVQHAGSYIAHFIVTGGSGEPEAIDGHDGAVACIDPAIPAQRGAGQ